MEADLFLKLGGAAVQVAEAAIELRDFVSQFDPEVMRWEEVYNSDEYFNLMETVLEYEEITNEIS